jgi:ribosomal protein L11
MKRYLRSYCNYQQNDWSKWLSMIEFASNVITFAFTELFVFLANYEFESKMNFDSIDIENTIRERILIKKAFNITKKMKNIWKFIKEKLTNAQRSQKWHVDKSRNFSFEYKVEDMIWLFIKNVKIERSSRKLDHKMIESYKIKKILRDVCQLNLSSSMKIHDTFHTSLLRSISTNSLIDQIQSSSSSIVMNDEKKYEMNNILNSRYHYDKLQYKIVWTDHLSDRAWYSTENFEHFKNILKNYHQRYSEKFESKLRLIVIIETILSQWIRNEHKKAKQLIQNVLNEMKTKMKENERMRSKESTLINTFDRH